jgi:hypothetical protein
VESEPFTLSRFPYERSDLSVFRWCLQGKRPEDDEDWEEKHSVAEFDGGFTGSQSRFIPLCDIR